MDKELIIRILETIVQRCKDNNGTTRITVGTTLSAIESAIILLKRSEDYDISRIMQGQ